MLLMNCYIRNKLCLNQNRMKTRVTIKVTGCYVEKKEEEEEKKERKKKDFFFRSKKLKKSHLRNFDVEKRDLSGGK